LGSLGQPSYTIPNLPFLPDPNVLEGWEGATNNNFSNVLQQNQKLVFLMNGGMFTPEYEPVGLFIENGKVLRETKILKDPSVNFGIQPQGIFAIYNDRADILHVPASTVGMVFAKQSAPAR
jgi:uncharacterized protein YigE (DUF2233 family)